ncbi:hypothetical protein [Nocardioides nanhaiensis]|uniref:hypothetical protein n=1 Tax=Nocardioides nanhaiensis TaxID=1476871 RepID=UPI0031EFDBF6
MAEEIAAARSGLRDAVSAARAELEALRRQPVFTEEEKRLLQETAQRGEMGPQMREFSEEVRRGNADWESFIRDRDRDPESRGLLEGFIQRSEDLHAEEAAEAFAATPPPEDVEDPRIPGQGPTAR